MSILSKSFSLTTGIVTASLLLVACSSKPTTVKTSSTSYRNIPMYHTVQRGDTVSKIANRYGLNYRQIGMLNRLDSNYTIHPGQRLQLTATQQRQQVQTRATSRPVTVATPSTATRTQSFNTVPSYTSSTKWLPPVNGRLIRGYDETAGTRGVWYAAPRGSAVSASQAGTVIYVGNGLPEYGNLVMIQHNNDYITAYAHLANFAVKEKQIVQAGQTIGTVAHVNEVNQPAVEFQIRYRGSPINPINMLK